jgi:hypothetical protein
MAEFIILAVIVIVGILIFGNADTKRGMLRGVGLDLSPQNFENKKANEFAKNCINAMYNSISMHKFESANEKEFINNLYKVLYKGSSFGSQYNNLAYLRIGTSYIDHALRVVERRYDDIEKGNIDVIKGVFDFSQNSDRKKYINLLWEKYQYPWPDGWLKTKNE